MLDLGTAVLQAAHDTLPSGDDDDRWNEFSAVFITSLVRRALAHLRDYEARSVHFTRSIAAVVYSIV